MYAIYDEVNDILYDRHHPIFQDEQEAAAYAERKNSIPPVKRRFPRPRPHFIAVEVVEDGFREELVGFSKAYKIVR